MKALRLIIHQSSANYKKEETVDNKMTYPLPPISTVIGAIHSACGYTEYHPMNISIQGKYESMHREPYTDYCFLNSVQDDRGILVKMRNGAMLSNAFEKVATAKKPQGNSFRNHVTIHVNNEKLLREYCYLKDVNDNIAEFKKVRLEPVIKMIKIRKKHLSEKKKLFDKKSEAYEAVIYREKEIKEMERQIKAKVDEYQLEYYSKPISRYRSLTTSLKFYEVLDNIDLIIHVQAEPEILKEIEENIYNLKSIGRSEDFVSVEEAKIVELQEKSESEVTSNNSAYIAYDMIKNGSVMCTNIEAGRIENGTMYYLNKRYDIIDGKRIFKFDNKVKAMYLSQYAADEFGDGIYLDRDEKAEYIVNFL